MDALAKAEGKSWVFQSADCLPPAYTRCLIELSHGGSDAAVVREFDTKTKDFVPGGFSLPEAKSSVAWRDEDTVWVGTDFGPGSLTTSGYPRIVKLWKRGTPLSAAKTIFEAAPEDVGAFGTSEILSDGRYDIVTRYPPMIFRQDLYLLRGDRLVKLDLPQDIDPRVFFRGRFLFSLRSDWTPVAGGKTYREGSLLAVTVDELVSGKPRIEVLFEPSARVSLANVKRTRDRVLLETLDNVKSRITALSLKGEAWERAEMPDARARHRGSDGHERRHGNVLLHLRGLHDPGLPLAERERRAAREGQDDAGVLRRDRDHDRAVRSHLQGRHEDPVLRGSAQGRARPTGPLRRSSTGTAASRPPWSPSTAALSDPRGSRAEASTSSPTSAAAGEFGPAWHKAAMKENHIRNFEDFSAVARDLVARKITSSRHLGIMGGSQGGLLVGGTFALYPDLFHAVVVQVPLADMRRYSKLLAGASWMAEYGDPDKPEEWAYIQTWSPYHLLKKDAKYPTPVLLDQHPRRPRPPGPRPQDGGEDGSPGTPGLLLREHRRRPRKRRRQQADRAGHGARVRLSVDDAAVRP